MSLQLAMPLVDPPLKLTATDCRDIALRRVTAHAGTWMDAALAVVAGLPEGLELTGEGIRAHVSAQVGNPHHHNAWGAVVRTAVRRGLLVATGAHVPMRDPKSHARQTPLYRVAA